MSLPHSPLRMEARPMGRSCPHPSNPPLWPASACLAPCSSKPEPPPLLLYPNFQLPSVSYLVPAEGLLPSLGGGRAVCPRRWLELGTYFPTSSTGSHPINEQPEGLGLEHQATHFKHGGDMSPIHRGLRARWLTTLYPSLQTKKGRRTLSLCQQHMCPDPVGVPRKLHGV